jgi:hypothetical protein
MKAITKIATIIALYSVAGATPLNAAYFSGTQTWDVYSSNWSQVCVSDYNTDSWSCASPQQGHYTVQWTLPYGSWKGFFVYDYVAGWDEAIYLLDQNL